MAPQTPTDNHPIADHGTQQRWQHAGRTFEHTGTPGTLAVRVIEENAVDILFLRRLISQRQNDAALRLMRDYHRAGLEPRVTGRYTAAARTQDVFAAARDRSDAEEAAYQPWRNAVRAIGMIYSEIVISVTCTAPAHSALAHLRKGLTVLGDWYGLPEEGVRIQDSGSSSWWFRVRSWIFGIP